LSGSYNPTDGGGINKNNLLIIESKTLAKNYRNEFEYLKSGRRSATVHDLILSGTPVENYFCPGDRCEDAVLAALSRAEHSIVFMTYSFTSDPIGRLLAAKAAEGVNVDGICEKQQVSMYSECSLLSARNYTGAGLLHHKVFIIDNKTVITGSYNPTASGDRRNNENVLIITNTSIAAAYLAEYEAIKLI
jgi:phosphatidylserine/phosphatidylglycerophosphate/cardiolipin synthase-like enzyme